MALHRATPTRHEGSHQVNPLAVLDSPELGEGLVLPTTRLSDQSMPAETAYQLIHDELMLDGNARLNLATFVTTWMEPPAARLMTECAEKNMIDKDEYPQTAELERRCVSILANLWNAPDADRTVGCSTTGSSEACMLGGLALKRRWTKRRSATGESTARPNLVMGANVQVCWEKFCNYWEVEARQVPMDGDRFHLSAEEAVARCDENTIGVVAILGSTFDGSYEPVAQIAAALDDLQARTGLDIDIHVDGASGAMIAPFVDEDLVWDFRLPRVASINTSGHKYGLVYPGVGWVLWRDHEALPKELVFNVNYLGGNMPTFALNFSATRSRGGGPVLHVPAPRLRRVSRSSAVRPRHRHPSRPADQPARALCSHHTRRRAPGLRVHHEAGHLQLQRLRRLAPAPGEWVARSCLYLP